LGEPYSHPLSAVGGSTPYNWQITAGDSTPSGLTLDPATGELTGTPNASGAFTFTAGVTDADSNTDSAEFTLKVISLVSDIDNNGLGDHWELQNFGDIGQDPTGNPDEDGADNQAEHDAGTNPNVADTDEDGVEDGPEIGFAGRDPVAIDREPLQWLEDFDAGANAPLLSAPRLWSFSGTFTADLTDTGAAFTDGRGLLLSTAQEETAVLIQHLETGFEPVIWAEFTAALAPYGADAEVPEVQPQTNSAFYITEDEEVKALDGATWQTLSASVGAGLVRYTIRQDFLDRTWDLWVNGIKITTTPLAFNAASTQQTIPYFRIQQAERQQAFFDSISISRAAPANLDEVEYVGTWQDDITWNGQSGLSHNPNRNNLTNLQEYAFGFSDPVEGGHTYQPPVEMVQDEGDNTTWLRLTFRRYRLAEDVEYILEKSNVLGEWEPLNPARTEVTITQHPTEPDVDLVTVEIPANEESAYMRLVTRLRD
jgi:hypothetical protein